MSKKPSYKQNLKTAIALAEELLKLAELKLNYAENDESEEDAVIDAYEVKDKLEFIIYYLREDK